MKKITSILTFVLLAFTCLLSTPLHSQISGFSKLYRNEADDIQRAEIITCIEADTSTNYLFFSSVAIRDSDGRVDASLFKTDLDGNILNFRSDTFSNGDLAIFSLKIDGSDIYWGGFATEIIESSSIPIPYFFLRKTDKNLNVVWDKKYMADARDINIWEIIVDKSSNSILLLGRKSTPADAATSDFPFTKDKIWLAKLDTLGNVISEHYPEPGNYTGAASMIKNQDGYLITGNTYNWEAASYGSAFALQIDSLCNEVWHELYLPSGASTSGIIGSAKSNLESNEYYYNAGYCVVPGLSESLALLNKIDAEGYEVWSQYLIGHTGINSFWDVTTTDVANHQVACGSSWNDEGVSGWLHAFTDDGTQKWSNRYTANPRSFDHEYLYKIVALPDGSVVAAGSSWGQDALGRWSQDGWLLKVDSNGCITPDCTLSAPDQKKIASKISVYPSPVSDGRFTLRSTLPFSADVTVTLTNNLGAKVMDLPSPGFVTEKNYQLSLAAGVYYLQIRDKGQLASVLKLVVL
jgi:hypothetical protein